MKGNLILNADPTTKLGAATKQYVDNSKLKQVYNGNLTNGKTISDVTNYRVMLGFVTITHNENSTINPYVRIDGLYLGQGIGRSKSTTDYCNFILFNFDNKSGTFFLSNTISSCSAQTQNKALTGKISFYRVSSAKLSLYAIS